MEHEGLEVSKSGEALRQLENVPSLEKIRLRAYEKYIERGGTDGRDLDDWMQAERELVEKLDAS
jgi:hypothetical protein